MDSKYYHTKLLEIQRLVDSILERAQKDPEYAKKLIEGLIKSIASHGKPNHEKQSDLCVTGDKKTPKSPLQEIWEVFDAPKTQ